MSKDKGSGLEYIIIYVYLYGYVVSESSDRKYVQAAPFKAGSFWVHAARAWNQSRAYWNSKLSNELVKESDLGQQASGKSS